jgi:hypothetical protein
MIPTDHADDDTIFTYESGIPLQPVHPGRTIAPSSKPATSAPTAPHS